MTSETDDDAKRYYEALVDTAPPLSDYQVAELRRLFNLNRSADSVPWCGSCDGETRLREVDEATGAQRRCPDCHPLAVKPRSRRRAPRAG